MSDKELIEAAANVARSAPTQWAAFIGQLSNYTELKRTHCVQASIDVLPVAQGRAQQCTALFELLRDSVKSADRNAQQGRK